MQPVLCLWMHSVPCFETFPYTTLYLLFVSCPRIYVGFGYCHSTRRSAGIADLIFVVRTSYAIQLEEDVSPEEFNIWKLIMREIVSLLPVQEDLVRVGIVTFDGDGFNEIANLNSFSDVTSVHTAIDNLSQTNATQRPDLVDVLSQTIELFNPSVGFGARVHSVPLLILMTTANTSGCECELEAAGNTVALNDISFSIFTPNFGIIQYYWFPYACVYPTNDPYDYFPSQVVLIQNITRSYVLSYQESCKLLITIL